MAEPGFIDIWVNCPDEAVAGRIAEESVAQRLVACANVLAPIRSVYRWQGTVEHGAEVPLVLKTRDTLFEPVARLVKELHPFEVPSIVATPLTHIDRAYAAWLMEEAHGDA
jgi:periplasmic divalent cation tolerance protein